MPSCCVKALPKYQQNVLAIFPEISSVKNSGRSDEISREVELATYSSRDSINDLANYAESFQRHIPRIGKFLLKKIENHAKDGNDLYVKIGLEAFQALSKTTRAQSAFDSILKAISLGITHPRPHVRIAACDLLSELVSRQPMDSLDDKAEPLLGPLLGVVTQPFSMDVCSVVEDPSTVPLQRWEKAPLSTIDLRLQLAHSALSGLTSMVSVNGCPFHLLNKAGTPTSPTFLWVFITTPLTFPLSLSSHSIQFFFFYFPFSSLLSPCS